MIKSIMDKSRMKNKTQMAIVMVFILIAVIISMLMVSCRVNDDSIGDIKEIKGSTIVETNRDGETIVIATDKDGETVVYERDKNGKINKSQKSSTKETTSRKQTKSTTAATTQGTTAAPANICHVSVEGYCSSMAVTLSGGDTAYSVLKGTGASVSATSSGYGIYVQAINGRWEKSEGSTSGWMYSVNGSTPNTSAGNYSVDRGDRISWYFVTGY